MGLEEAEFELCFFGHHLFVPWWIEGELHVAIEHFGKSFDLFLYIADDVACHGACRRGECHGDLDIAFVADPDIVDEAEIEDVDGDLGVEDGAECSFDVIAESAHDSTDFFDKRGRIA